MAVIVQWAYSTETPVEVPLLGSVRTVVAGNITRFVLRHPKTAQATIAGVPANLLAMTYSSIGVEQKLRAVDLGNMPNLQDIEDPYVQILWFLKVAKLAGIRRLGHYEICDLMWHVFDVHIDYNVADGLLRGKEQEVGDRIRGRKITLSGEKLLWKRVPNILFIDPSAPLTGRRQVQQVMSELQGKVRICDPWIGEKTLDVLAQMTSVVSIQMLSHNIDSLDRQTCKDFTTEYGIPLSIRSTKKDVIHDRYIIHKRGLVTVGTSLNGLGNKQTFVVKEGSDIANAVGKRFQELWGPAQSTSVC